MKKFLYYFLACVLILNLVELRAETGKIDICIAVSLHPSMSLFDFDRMGFFKVSPGLDEEAFAAAIEKLKRSPEINELREQKKNLENDYAALERQRALLSAKMGNVNQKQGEEIKQQINQVVESQLRLRSQTDDLKYQIECPDLTSPTETREKLDSIENEVIETIKLIAREQKLSVVLNNSTPYTTGYPLKYLSGPLFGQGIPGIDYQLFYSFLANRRSEDSSPPSSRDIINWLELTHFPGAVDLLPVKPWPLVLHGGKSILRDVINHIYRKHNLSEEIIQTIDSVINKIEE